MNAIPPGDNPPSSPPDGLLAGALAATLDAKVEGVMAKPPSEGEPIHQASSLDPNYSEPPTPGQLRQTVDGVAAMGIDALRQFAFALIERIDMLEVALRPVATQAVIVANARILLIAAGRNNEPAAGVWVNGVQHTQMTPNEAIFYNACDVYGRARVEQHMMSAFERVQKAQEGGAEKEVYIEGGGKLQ